MSQVFSAGVFVLALVPAWGLAKLDVTTEQARNAGYDPKRDPAQDLEALIKQARLDDKRILLVVGGEWCGWCHTLENYLKANEDVRTAWSNSFLSLKVNYSPDNPNRAFLSRYPNIPGYPHIYVLEKDGTLLHSQNTVELEQGSSYSKDAMMRFAGKWRGGSRQADYDAAVRIAVVASMRAARRAGR
jgi:thiol:disulfide interchange protein